MYYCIKIRVGEPGVAKPVLTRSSHSILESQCFLFSIATAFIHQSHILSVRSFCVFVFVKKEFSTLSNLSVTDFHLSRKPF